jgi:hypothetical protein
VQCVREEEKDSSITQIAHDMTGAPSNVKMAVFMFACVKLTVSKPHMLGAV